MNLCLEINPDKHSNLRDFICSLKLRCTSEKRFGGEAAGGAVEWHAHLRLFASDLLLCGGALCVNGRRGAWSFGQGYVLSFFFFSLSSWNGAIILHARAERLRTLKSKRKPFFFFFFFETNTKCLVGPSCAPLGQALSLLTVFMCDFWGVWGCGRFTVSVLKTGNRKNKTRNKCFMKQTCTSLPCSFFVCYFWSLVCCQQLHPSTSFFIFIFFKSYLFFLINTFF